MTNSEAIKYLKLMRYNDANTGDMDRALEMAIEALEGKDTNVPSSCSEKPNRSDLISRQDAIYHCRKRLYQTAEVNRPIEVYADIAENRIGEWLNELPSVQPETDQIQWERDIAIQQLKDLGYGLGEKPRKDGDAISRQDAIDAFGLSEKTRKYGGDHSGYDTMMLYEIQGTLESLPSAQPELIEKTAYIRGFEQGRTQGMLDSQGGKNLQPTCNNLATDTISRQDAINAFEPDHRRDWYTPEIIETLEDLPSAQPERKPVIRCWCPKCGFEMIPTIDSENGWG